MTLRVVHLTRDYPPAGVGGISTAVAGLVAAQRAAGWSVVVVSFERWRPARGAPPSPPASDIAATEVVRVATDAAAEDALSRLSGLGWDIVHAHHAMLWPWARRWASASRAATVKSVHVLQGLANQLRGVASTASAVAQAEALAEAERVVVASQFAAAALAGWQPAVAARLHVAPLGVDHDPAFASPVGCRRDPRLVAYVGRFDDLKGTDILFAVIDALGRARPSARFAVAGGVPANPRAERRWREQAQARWPAEVAARVAWLGWREGAELAQLYTSAAVVLAPSRIETFGLTVAEAMWHGAAVVGAAGTAHAELITPEVTGRLASGDDGFVAATRDLLDDSDRARALGAAAAAHARAQFAWRACWPAHRDAYGPLDRPA